MFPYYERIEDIMIGVFVNIVSAKTFMLFGAVPLPLVPT